MNRISKLLIAAALVAVSAPALVAQPMGGGPEGGMLVAADGTALVLKATATQGTVDLVAIKRDGTTLWTASLTGGHVELALSGNLLIVASGGAAASGPGTGTAAAAGSLAALQLANGTQVWKTAVDGVLDGITVASDQIYGTLTKVTASTSTGTGSGGTGTGPGGHGGQGGSGSATVTRSLAAFGLDGAARWTVKLSS